MTGNSSVRVDAQEVANGVAQWNGASGALESAWTSAIGKINGLNNASTWGGDEPGQSFEGNYMGKGKAGEFATNGKPLITQVTGLGNKVHAAAARSLGADQAQADKMKIDVEINIPGLTS